MCVRSLEFVPTADVSKALKKQCMILRQLCTWQRYISSVLSIYY